ncbi:MAG TPA: 50S ribosomal protein L23 [Planctomycetota bacterium]|nr:50S ribosomal protein L23 [Planctomycetota bacterium]HUV37999.1 50S ribosomal protein L23 [Planctomycetota bacterium]
MKELNAYQVVLRPLVTEKAVGQQEERVYWFAVHPSANKTQIRRAVEEIYQVHVKQVQTLRQKGKLRRSRYKLYRTAEWKKASVTLAPDERIDII